VKPAILALVMLVISAHAVAQPVATPGANMIEACRTMVTGVEAQYTEWTLQSTYLSGLCIGAMNAVIDTNDIYSGYLRGKALFCPPDTGITPLMAAKVVIKYPLESYSHTLQQRPVSMMVKALSQEYPCPESTPEAIERLERHEGMSVEL
jgi:hypothetical protein